MTARHPSGAGPACLSAAERREGESAMKYNQLGRTGLFVSEICLGTMTFGGNEDAGMWKAIGALQQDEVDKIVGRALEAGVNFFDTADVYSFGESEKRLGQAFK